MTTYKDVARELLQSFDRCVGFRSGSTRDVRQVLRSARVTVSGTPSNNCLTIARRNDFVGGSGLSA